MPPFDSPMLACGIPMYQLTTVSVIARPLHCRRKKGADLGAEERPRFLAVCWHGESRTTLDEKRRQTQELVYMAMHASVKLGVPVVIGGDFNFELTYSYYCHDFSFADDVKSVSRERGLVSSLGFFRRLQALQQQCSISLQTAARWLTSTRMGACVWGLWG